MRHRTTDGRRLAAALLLCVLAGAAIAPAAGATATSVQFAQTGEETTISVESTTVASGEQTSVDVVLTSAPAGISGYNLTIRLSGAESARITGVTYPEDLGLTSDPQIGDDERTVEIEAADVDERIGPGATDVALATVEVEGLNAGSATVEVAEAELDGDGGERLSPATSPGTVSAAESTQTRTASSTDAETRMPGGATPTGTSAGRTSEGTDGDAVSDAGTTDADGPGFGVVAALAALLIGAGIARRRE